VVDGQLYLPGVTPIVRIDEPRLDRARSSITLNGAPFASGTPVLAPNSYELKIEAVDEAGNRSSRSVRFTVQGE
jgi:hypothetical protein